LDYGILCDIHNYDAYEFINPIFKNDFIGHMFNWFKFILSKLEIYINWD